MKYLVIAKFFSMVIALVSMTLDHSNKDTKEVIIWYFDMLMNWHTISFNYQQIYFFKVLVAGNNFLKKTTEVYHLITTTGQWDVSTSFDVILYVIDNLIWHKTIKVALLQITPFLYILYWRCMSHDVFYC